MQKFKHKASHIEQSNEKQFVSKELKDLIVSGNFIRDWGFIHDFPEDITIPDANYLEDLGRFSNHWILLKITDINENYFYRFQLTFWEPGMEEPFYYIPNNTFSHNPCIALYKDNEALSNDSMDYINETWQAGPKAPLDEYTEFENGTRYYAVGDYDNRGSRIEVVGTSLSRILDGRTDDPLDTVFEPKIGGVTVSPKKALKFDMRSYRGVDGEIVFNVSDSRLYVATPRASQKTKEIILEDKFITKGNKVKTNGTKLQLISTINGVDEVISEAQLPNLGGEAGNIFEQVSMLAEKVAELEKKIESHMEKIL